MQKDEILEEIWEFRKKHAVKFNYDVRKIMEDHKKLGQSVATMRNGKAVLTPAEEIEIIDERQSSKKT